jgi:signal-transduction protein with cAMP-binding, CBS, and nucleotidyltransferase domain
MAKIEKHFTRDPIGVEASAPCRAAARLMAEHRIGAVAVRDGNQTIGLVTERDLVARVIASEGQADLPVGKVVRRNLPSVSPEASEMECSNLMRDHNTRHLLVAERGKITGIISMRDVIRLMLDEKQFLIEQLQSYITRG